MSQPSPPRWQDLLTRYLVKPQDLPSEVEPYQAQPALGLDLATAWEDAVLPGTALGESPQAAYPDAWQQTRSFQWSAPFPCCIGLAPQFLQQIHGLMQDSVAFFNTPLELKAGGTALEPPRDLPWLSHLALARVTGDFTRVDILLAESAGRSRTLLENERAAQAWLRGDRTTAARHWAKLPESEPVIAFNQALACLARGDGARGSILLTQAAAAFPETTGWRHLADLYRVALGD